MTKIAYFISPHGFGHAARACAVMQSLAEVDPHLEFEIFTRVPRWFFEESHLPSYQYHEYQTDLGLVQRNSLEEDLPETLKKLAEFLPFDSKLVNKLAEEVIQLSCRLVVCDIAPLGIAVAQAAGLQSILIENFTWDWIYANYAVEAPKFKKFIKYLSVIFRQATCHIQTTPVCNPDATLLTTSPVSRSHFEPPEQVHSRLGLTNQAKSILITMGGIESNFALIDRLIEIKHVNFIIPGASSAIQHDSNCILLPHHSGFYHPDLVRACDAVVGKLGYSTLAEAYTANRPFGFIPRASFRESPPLAHFVINQMNGLLITEKDYHTGDWIKSIPALLDKSDNKPPRNNGASEVAQFIIRRLQE